jgi:hypothetical protein
MEDRKKKKRGRKGKSSTYSSDPLLRAFAALRASPTAFASRHPRCQKPVERGGGKRRRYQKREGEGRRERERHTPQSPS